MSSLSPALQPKSGAAEFASPPVTIVLTAILLLFFFIGFFSIYCCRCLVEGMVLRSQTASLEAGNVGEAPINSGIEPELIEIFPTFTYASVKQLRKEKPELECVICLSEVSGEDVLRLITVCYHCFHKECIDSWLESHKTCPVCRRNLDLPREELKHFTSCTTVDPDRLHSTDEAGEVSATSSSASVVTSEHDIRINIYDATSGGETTEQGGSRQLKGEESHAHDGISFRTEAYTRSHSTGHSIISLFDQSSDDRYTLRLPEHVMSEVKRTRGHGATVSCTALGELTHHLPVVRSADR